jgi:hypothetical protein
MKSNDERRPRLLASILRHLRGQFLGAIALFVALGGTSYAALELPAGSVGNRQIKNHVITPIKFDKSTIAGYVRAYAQISADGQITESRPSASVVVWRTGSFQPGGLIQWSQAIPAACFALATTSNLGAVGYASAQLASGGKHDAQTYVVLSAPGQAVSVAIVCPEP